MLKKKYQYDVEVIEQKIYKEKGYTEDLVNQWIDKYKDNKLIQKLISDIEHHKKCVFGDF